MTKSVGSFLANSSPEFDKKLDSCLAHLDYSDCIRLLKWVQTRLKQLTSKRMQVDHVGSYLENTPKDIYDNLDDCLIQLDLEDCLNFLNWLQDHIRTLMNIEPYASINTKFAANIKSKLD